MPHPNRDSVPRAHHGRGRYNTNHSPSASVFARSFPMTVIRLLAPALLCAAAAAPVSADVTLQSKRTETHGGAGPIVTNSTEYRKGLRMRTDSSGPITSRSTIVDAGTGRMITLWHEDKIAEVSNWGQDTAPPDRGETPELKQSITPTGRSRQIAGSTCVVY